MGRIRLCQSAKHRQAPRVPAMRWVRIAAHLLLHIDIGDSFGAPHEAVPHNRPNGVLEESIGNTVIERFESVHLGCNV